MEAVPTTKSGISKIFKSRKASRSASIRWVYPGKSWTAGHDIIFARLALQWINGTATLSLLSCNTVVLLSFLSHIFAPYFRISSYVLVPVPFHIFSTKFCSIDCRTASHSISINLKNQTSRLDAARRWPTHFCLQIKDIFYLEGMEFWF